MQPQEIAGWGGVIVAAVLGGGALFKRLIEKLFDDWLAQREVTRAEKRDEKAQLWLKHANAIQSLESRLQEAAAEIRAANNRERDLLERIIAIRSEADKDLELFAAAVTTLEHRLSESSRPPTLPQPEKTPPRFAAKSDQRIAPRLPKPQE